MGSGSIETKSAKLTCTTDFSRSDEAIVIALLGIPYLD